MVEVSSEISIDNTEVVLSIRKKDICQLYVLKGSEALFLL